MVVHVGSNLHEANGYVQFGCRLEFGSIDRNGRQAVEDIACPPPGTFVGGPFGRGREWGGQLLHPIELGGRERIGICSRDGITDFRGGRRGSFFEERVTIDGGQRASGHSK